MPPSDIFCIFWADRIINEFKMKWFQKKDDRGATWEVLTEALIKVRGQGQFRADVVQLRKQHLILLSHPLAETEIKIHVTPELGLVHAEATRKDWKLTLAQVKGPEDFLQQTFQLLHPQPFLRTDKKDIHYNRKPKTSPK